LKFEIMEIKPRAPWPIHFLFLHGYSVTIRFENGKQIKVNNYSPDSDLFFYVLDREIHNTLNRGECSEWTQGIKNLLVTKYHFKNRNSYQKYDDLFRTGKVDYPDEKAEEEAAELSSNKATREESP